jgi:hypothetical protein
MAETPHEQTGVKTRSRAGKVAVLPIAGAETDSASFTAFPLKNHGTFPIKEPRKICKKQEVL